MQNPILMTVVWCVVILLIFMPLGVARYRKAAAR